MLCGGRTALVYRRSGERLLSLESYPVVAFLSTRQSSSGYTQFRRASCWEAPTSTRRAPLIIGQKSAERIGQVGDSSIGQLADLFPQAGGQCRPRSRAVLSPQLVPIGCGSASGADGICARTQQTCYPCHAAIISQRRLRWGTASSRKPDISMLPPEGDARVPCASLERGSPKKTPREPGRTAVQPLSGKKEGETNCRNRRK